VRFVGYYITVCQLMHRENNIKSCEILATTCVLELTSHC